MERNKENFAKFDRIFSLAEKLNETYDEGIGISYTDINAGVQNAIVVVEASSPMLFDSFKLRTILTEMIITADDFVVAKTEEDGNIRLSFGVRNVFEP